MLKIFIFATTEGNGNNSINWATKTREAITLITYIYLNHPGLNSDHVPLSRTYGPNDGLVLTMKREYDLMVILNPSIPRFTKYMPINYTSFLLLFSLFRLDETQQSRHDST